MAKSSDESWRTQPVSAQVAAILIILASLVSSIGGGGVVRAFGDSSDINPEVALQLQDMNARIEGIDEKVDDIYEIVDWAHPRGSGPNPQPDP